MRTAGLGGLSRAGLALCALAAALAASAPLAGDIVRGPARRGGMELTATIGGDLTGVAIALVALLVGAALARRLWAHLAGIALGTVVAYGAAGQVAAARLSRDFAPEAELVLLAGGTQLATAAAVAVVGVVVVLAGVRLSPRPVAPGRVRTVGDPSDPTSANAVAAPVLALVGILLGLLPPLAIAVGTLALLDIRESGPGLRGRGLALAGVAIGIMVFSLYVAGLAAGVITAAPPA